MSDQTHFAAGECFTVNPVTPEITTTVPVAVVSPGASITDRAHLTGTANQPGSPVINPTTVGAAAGGTITFRLYGPTATSTASCTEANLVFTSAPVTVSGDRATPLFYESAAFTVNAPGFYHWVATYSGNLPNTNGDAGQCGDANETVQVLQIPTEIKTKQSWFPNDTATISPRQATSAPTVRRVQPLRNVGLFRRRAVHRDEVDHRWNAQPGGRHEQHDDRRFDRLRDAANSVKPGGTEVYSWKVVYTPNAADTSHTGKQSACSAEHFTITYTNDNGPGTNLP